MKDGKRNFDIYFEEILFIINISLIINFLKIPSQPVTSYPLNAFHPILKSDFSKSSCVFTQL